MAEQLEGPRAKARRTKLTKDFVKTAIVALRKDGTPLDRTTYPDKALPGFALEVTRDGSKSFVVSYRKGRGRHAPRRQMKIAAATAADPGVARERAKQILAQVVQGRGPLGEQQAETAKATNSLKSICEAFLARKGKMKRTDDGTVTFGDDRELRSAPRVLQDFERLVYPEKIASRSIDDIKRRQLKDLFDKIEDERGAVILDLVRASARARGS